MACAELSSEDLDAVFPSSSGAVSRDRVDVDVLKVVFDSGLATVPLYPTKAVFGECLVAAGPLQCIAALYALHRAPQLDLASCKTERFCDEDLLLPERLSRCQRALVYEIGPDLTASAVVISRC